MTHDHFDEPVAARYDESSAAMFDPAVLDPAVDFLAALAGDGPALELGIGTGRIALPLSARGVRVHGIDLSAAMIAQLRAKPGAAGIETTVGDFATTRVPGEFTLVYLVFNTIWNLTTQDAQVACFENVAAHLAPGGCFVVEVGVPGLQRLMPDHAEPFHFLDPVLAVGDHPVARNQLRGDLAGIANGERIGEGVLPMLRIRFLGDIPDL